MKKNLSKIKNGLFAITIPWIQPVPDGTVDYNTPKEIVTALIEYALWFVGAIALVFVVYGGILYITSGGDAGKTKKARDTILYAVIGIIIVVAAIAIINFAKSTGTQLSK